MLLSRRDASELYAKRVAGSVMDHFTVQGQSFILVNQEQPKFVAHPNIRTRWKIRHAKTPKTDV
jgi:hypothetical protein